MIGSEAGQQQQQGTTEAVTKHQCLAAPATNPNPCRCLLYLQATYHNRTLRFVVDSGATVNLVDPSLLTDTDTRVQVPPLEIKGINGQKQPLAQQVTLTFELAGYPYSFAFYVAPGLPVSAILGLEAIVDSGWLVDATYRRLLHINHALPPIKLAPCAHTALLAYAMTDTVIPPRSWKHVTARNPYAAQHERVCGLVCFTPTPPATAPLHGAPAVALASADAIPLLLCNTSEHPIQVPKHAPLAYLDGCEEMELSSSTSASQLLAAPVVGGKEMRKREEQEGEERREKVKTEEVEEAERVKWKGK